MYKKINCFLLTYIDLKPRLQFGHYGCKEMVSHTITNYWIS